MTVSLHARNEGRDRLPEIDIVSAKVSVLVDETVSPN
jgi:hypothetical protein